MKSDARHFLNRKKQKSVSIPGGVDDARKILDSKLKKKRLNKGNFLRARTPGMSSNPFVYRSFSSHNKKPVFSELKSAPKKDVKLTKDGNIFITARSKNSINRDISTDFSRTSLSTRNKIIENVPRWIPSNVETVDVEHVGISDVLDMDSLPTAVVGSNNKSCGRLRSLADEIIDMQDTMVADQVSSPQKGAFIRVSNLHTSVSKQDIMELFGDVGLIKGAEMVQPGTADIEFFYSSDAVKACELYHNRLLDGLPMQCFIRPQAPQRTLISQRLGERLQSTSINHNFPSTSSANSRVMHNPRNVQFTVKLT